MIEVCKIHVAAGLKHELLTPSSICFSKDYETLYVADMGNKRVRALKIRDNVLYTLTDAIKAESVKSFEIPITITADDSGCIYLADSKYNMIFKWAEKNQYWEAVYEAEIKAAVPDINFIGSINTEPEGNIYFTDFHNNRIWRLDIQGRITGLEIDGLNKPYGVFYRNNRLYYTNTGKSSIEYIELDTFKIHKIISEKDIGRVFYPIALTVDGGGNIYFCEARKLYYYDAANGSTTEILSPSSWKIKMEKFSLPYKLCHIGALALDHENKSLYITDSIKSLIYRLEINL